MDRAGLITLEQARAAGLSFDEPEPRACPHCGAALDPLERLTAKRQTEAVDRDDGQTVVADLEELAHVNGTGLVRGDGEGGLLDHGAQRLFRQGDGILLLDLRQLRKVGGGEGENVEVSIAAGKMDHELFIGREGDHIVGHTADDVAEQARGEDQLTALLLLNGKAGADAGLHIVAGDGQAFAAAGQQQALERGDGALRRHGAGGGIDCVLQQQLFAGKFHSGLPFVNGKIFLFWKRKKDSF